jgi:hypothetical protein
MGSGRKHNKMPQDSKSTLCFCFLRFKSSLGLVNHPLN